MTTSIGEINIGKALKIRRVMLGLSQEALADRTKGKGETNALSQRTVSALETQRLHPGDLSALRLGSLIHALEWTPETFETETGIALPGWVIDKNLHEETSIPLHVYTIPSYSAGTGPAWDLADAEMISVYLPELKGRNLKKIVGLFARGDSMTPYLPKNSLAIVYLDPAQVQIGSAVSVWFSNDGVCIKRFWGEDKRGSLILGNDNPAYENVFNPPDGSRITGIVIKRVLEG